jgi:hypothetical protein
MVDNVETDLAQARAIAKAVYEQLDLDNESGNNFTLFGSVLGTFIEHRLNENRDAKIIITSKGSTTGLGKSTLAIAICRFVEEQLAGRDWDVEERAYIDVQKYISKYKSCPQNSALLIDEIEYSADNRRAMSQDNVDLSHAWAQLRYRNVVSVATLPSVSMLDKRMMELADIWINVIQKGKALPHYLSINDYTGRLQKQMLRHPKTGQTEVITWPDLANDPDYRYLTNLKDQNVRTGDSEQLYDKDDLDKKVEQAKKEKRNELIKSFYESEHTNISYAKLGDVVGLSQSMIDVIVNDK